MKKLVLILCMFFACMGVSFAQQGIQSIGIHLSYGTEIENAGLGIKYQYNVTNNLRLEPSMEYFFKKDAVDMYDINMNIHYLIPIQEQVRFYPLAGLTYTNWNWDLGKTEIGGANLNVDASKSKFGANFGGGIEFDITNNFMLNFEAKYQLISDFDQAVVNFGVAYMF